MPTIDTYYLKTILDYIEAHVYEDIPLKSFSGIANYSLMQIYRDFYSMTGHSLNEYIRKRRLSNALTLVKHSSVPLVDIAYRCGYSSQQNFAKAVKQILDISPTDYRNSDVYYYFPMYEICSEKQVTVKTTHIPQTTGFRFYDDQYIGIENKALKALFQTMPHMSGRIFGRQGKQRDTQFCYELYLSKMQDVRHVLAHNQFESIGLLPAHTQLYAAIRVTNNEDQINSAWNYLYNDWLQRSMFTVADTPYFEEYILCDHGIRKLMLYLPIQKRSSLKRIDFETLDSISFYFCEQTGFCADETVTEALLHVIRQQPGYLHLDTHRFLIIKQDDRYLCAIPSAEISQTIYRTLTVPCGMYAVLEGECCEEYSSYETILRSFMKEHSIEWDNFPMFAIYQSNGDFDNIQMKLYCKIKHVNNGKDVFPQIC